jgi:hypothetical protein
MMNSVTRTERIAAGLERHFEHCDARLRDCNSSVEKSGRFGEWEVDTTVKLMKTGVQIAGMIARLEARAAQDSKNSGSIPQ